MIEIVNLHIKLGDFELKNINFKVDEGEFFIILGPTGAGKSVIIETVAGVLQPDLGQVLINNKDVTRLKPERRNISICYQDYVLFPHMTVKENIKYGLKYRNRSQTELFDRIVQLLDIKHLLQRYPENLSGGEKQRVSLARALIVKPEVLLLDEPLAALDTNIKDRLMRDIKRLHIEFDMTTIMITHSFQEAFFLGERGSVIHQGEILQTNIMEKLFLHPNSPFVSNFVGLKNVFKSDYFYGGDFGSPFIGIRPENIQVYKEPVKSSYKGKIEEISNMGNYYELIISTDFGKVIAMVMIGDYIKDYFEINDQVYFSFDKGDVQMIDNYQVST